MRSKQEMCLDWKTELPCNGCVVSRREVECLGPGFYVRGVRDILGMCLPADA